MGTTLNSDQKICGRLVLSAILLIGLSPVLYIADMILNNDFVAYDASKEGPLTTAATVCAVVAVMLGAAGVRYGFRGDRVADRPLRWATKGAIVICALFGMWSMLALSWILGY